MPVEDWAREQARQIAKESSGTLMGPHAVKLGIVHAFSALLSDEAVEAGARHLHDGDWGSAREVVKAADIDAVRAALQAAIAAVTEGGKP